MSNARVDVERDGTRVLLVIQGAGQPVCVKFSPNAARAVAAMIEAAASARCDTTLSATVRGAVETEDEPEPFSEAQ